MFLVSLWILCPNTHCPISTVKIVLVTAITFTCTVFNCLLTLWLPLSLIVYLCCNLHCLWLLTFRALAGLKLNSWTPPLLALWPPPFAYPVNSWTPIPYPVISEIQHFPNTELLNSFLWSHLGPHLCFHLHCLWLVMYTLTCTVFDCLLILSHCTSQYWLSTV